MDHLGLDRGFQPTGFDMIGYDGHTWIMVWSETVLITTWCLRLYYGIVGELTMLPSGLGGTGKACDIPRDYVGLYSATTHSDSGMAGEFSCL